MKEALLVLEYVDAEMKKSKDEMLLIKIRYQTELATMYYVKGDYKMAKEYIDKSLEICGNEANYTYDTVA